MWFIAPRKKPNNQQARPEHGSEATDSEQLLVDGRTGTVFAAQYDKQLAQQQAEAGPEPEPDSVDEALAGDYEPAIVEEIREEYEKPVWEEEVSSLDPVENVDDFIEHGFNIPPAAYDELQRAGAKQLHRLERLKQPLEPEERAKVEQRIALVKDRSLEDVKWLKHKAYYRSMEKIRAEKAAAQQDRQAREAYLASKGAPLDVVPVEAIDAPGPMQQQQQQRQESSAGTSTSAAAATAGRAHQEDVTVFYRPLSASVAELIDIQRAHQPSEGSEWAEGWDSMGYLQHESARRQLFNAFNQAVNPGAPWAHPGGAYAPLEAFEEGSEIESDVQEAQQQALALAMGQRKQKFLNSSVSGTAGSKYTPDFLEIQRLTKRHDRQAAQRRHAFVLGLAGGLGALAVKQLLRAFRKPGDGSSRPPSRAGSATSSLAVA